MLINLTKVYMKKIIIINKTLKSIKYLTLNYYFKPIKKKEEKLGKQINKLNHYK